jgi:type I restriction enzyme S subunit
MTQLPTGWSYESINSIVEGGMVADGDWVESKDQDSNGQVRLTQLADVGDGEFRSRSDRWMNDEQASRLNVNYLRPGDLLMARMPDPLGRTCMVPENIGRAVTVVDVAIIRIARKDVNPKFVMWLLNSPGIRQQIEMLASGTTRRRITRKNLGTIDLPMPPIDEQNTIVELLEDHLSRLDAALADVKQAKVKAAQFKVAFLRNVFSGDASWNSIPMKQLGKWGGGGTPSKANEKFWTDGTVPWLSPKDMGPLEITQTVDKITEEACLNSTVKKIPENSVVFVVRSGILERKLPIALTKVETTLNQDMKALTFSDKVNPKFGFYSMLGLEQDILRTCRKSGTTVASINTESLMNYEIKIPSLPVQAEILDYVDSQLTLIDNSVPQVESVLKVGNSLRRSLLQAAFTGQLTKEVVSV